MRSQKVLVIEDDTWMNEVYVRTLRNAGFKVKVATNALEGMDMIDEYRPDVIVLDLYLPGPNAVVLLHELRSHVDLAVIPVVLSTNNAAEISADALESYGVCSILDKTVMTPEDVVGAVRKVIL